MTDEDRRTLQRRGDRWWRQMLSQLILVVAFTVALLVQQHDTTRTTRHIEAQLRRAAIQLANNCSATHDADVKFNKALDVIIQRSIASKTLTTWRRRRRSPQYAPLHLPILDCPAVN
jgi:type II secretory pathway component PulL